MILVNFGSIFRYKEEEFVHLGETPEGDVLYAARIWDHTTTSKLKKADELYSKNPRSPINEGTLLCFVVLTTEDFDGRAAHLHNADGNANPSSNVEYIGKSLNEKDSNKLREVILKDKAIPEKLRKIVERFKK